MSSGLLTLRFIYFKIDDQSSDHTLNGELVRQKNPGSTVFSETDTSNAITNVVIWLHRGLIETDPRKPRDFRLLNIGEDQLFL